MVSRDGVHVLSQLSKTLLSVARNLYSPIIHARFVTNYKKDRGMNPDDSEHLNGLHVKRAQKEAARRAAQEAGR
ncbi:MAG: hypothetical protein A3F84_04590 [Candidatus Handelsmanbacteria bacterium RIFCSPLOWO2_12_FULL_64_10]|uniref:Uncharacterized protein n=1 Tax=Handelsmanbacteria sp. (strain RIFCSPLOWO2_12_FULL_64_10) TaxID=1817868 RepID=A0A1F6C4W7_HANXR|nr:MAG: hypothetical protein A3F84_04590 [Candidatus Handelsmanbacteria bacterium RIFCSPLOWO2_12_FULL_64_10]